MKQKKLLNKYKIIFLYTITVQKVKMQNLENDSKDQMRSKKQVYFMFSNELLLLYFLLFISSF